MNSKIFLIAGVVVALGWVGVAVYPESVVTQPPGIICPEAPKQVAILDGKPILHVDYMITPLASFTLNGRVLSRENYWWGDDADLAPVDLAMGWMEMSDQNVVDLLDISQGSRWYRWKYDDFPPIPRRQVEVCSANMHIIPANKQVERTLDDICKGNIIHFKGYLVKVTREDGWRWISSLTREDTGDGACEVVYVEELEIIS